MRILFLSLIVFTFSSCELLQPEPKVVMPSDKNLARATLYGGKWHVFINSMPVQPYDEVGKETLNVLLEGVEQKQNLKNILKGMVDNASFTDKLNNMLERVSSDSTYCYKRYEW